MDTLAPTPLPFVGPSVQSGKAQSSVLMSQTHGSNVRKGDVFCPRASPSKSEAGRQEVWLSQDTLVLATWTTKSWGSLLGKLLPRHWEAKRLNKGP